MTAQRQGAEQFAAAPQEELAGLSFNDVKDYIKSIGEQYLDKAIEKIREELADDPEAQTAIDKVIDVLERLKA